MEVGRSDCRKLFQASCNKIEKSVSDNGGETPKIGAVVGVLAEESMVFGRSRPVGRHQAM